MITLLSPGAPLPRASIDVQTANDKKNTSEKDDEPDVSETVSFEELLRTEEARSKPSAADISIAEAEKQLDGLIGLSRAKQQIKTFINQYKLNQLRQKEGLSVLPINLHMVFIGNPGTGKTTVARLFGKYLKAAGILPQGHTVEISGNELTSKWMGETDKITRKKLRESLGGVLFIDEAYSIVAETSINGENGGEPIIAELLKYMEDHNGEFMLIVAGYPDEMHKFVHFNPGLKSRFRSTIVFENFSSAELVQVYHSFAKEYQYNLAGGCDEVLSRIMSNASLKYAKSFGNGRFVRNLFEKTLERIANRLAVVTGPTRNDLEMITPFDIASAAEELERENKFGKKH
jgi:SpoVK/Ycf46/Vps4 family AAA+-type ATPase